MTPGDTNIAPRADDPEFGEALRRLIELLAASEGTAFEQLAPLATSRVLTELFAPDDRELVIRRVAYLLELLRDVAAGGVASMSREIGVTYPEALEGVRRKYERQIAEARGDDD